ncbi:MAG TPA: ATP-binding protein [Puia sp.]|nr:ATP-binding protein [Puia sp.]
MTFDLIVTIVITWYLRRSLEMAAKLPKWDHIFKYILYAAIGLFVINVALPQSRIVAVWLSHLLMLYLIYLLYSEKELQAARQVLFAIAPYIILSLFTDIAKLADANRYSGWKSFFEAATVFSVIYMFVMAVIINKQKKALEKEKQKTKVEEEKKKEVISLKDQLEIQVAERTAELTKQKEELEHTVAELKSTQTQLIQAEKMASLGELTAGIAHEIQNPLNFVNNFSEVSNELIVEMNEELEKGDINEAKAIAENIKQNLEKINHHGKRADAIVKGMLQHSRKNTGQKELTDINELADEYLRLSYHGLRAKDKSFNASMKTVFDPTIGKINIVPQDMGRVLLNLINNAFYAVTEKKKAIPKHEGGPHYEPTVTVTTRRVGLPNVNIGRIYIHVKDNGNGVPLNIVDKIFQPFFTTKPTGQGTGLGLSMSYDIIKAHSGELKVNTKEGEGAEFIIKLPIS